MCESREGRGERCAIPSLLELLHPILRMRPACDKHGASKGSGKQEHGRGERGTTKGQDWAVGSASSKNDATRVLFECYLHDIRVLWEYYTMLYTDECQARQNREGGRRQGTLRRGENGERAIEEVTITSHPLAFRRRTRQQ
jgi:hypothetical protein